MNTTRKYGPTGAPERARPHTLDAYPLQADRAAESRRLQMRPVHARTPPERATPVDHFLGEPEDVVLGAPADTESPVGAKRITDRSRNKHAD